MLILTRKPSQMIEIGDDIIVRIMEVNGNQVKVGIEAPTHVSVHRSEIGDRIRREERLAKAKSK